MFLFRPRPGRLATVPWAVKLLYDVAHSGHRNIKISGSRLVTLRLSMLFQNFGSQILRQFFALLSFLHAQYGTHRHTIQRLCQLFSILTGCKCDFYITSTCYLPQVSLNTNERSITCLKYNFEKVPIILFSQFLEFCVE